MFLSLFSLLWSTFDCFITEIYQRNNAYREHQQVEIMDLSSVHLEPIRYYLHFWAQTLISASSTTSPHKPLTTWMANLSCTNSFRHFSKTSAMHETFVLQLFLFLITSKHHPCTYFLLAFLSRLIIFFGFASTSR